MGHVDLQLHVSRDTETDEWKGSGLYSGTGSLSPFGEIAGLGDESTSHLKRVVSGTIASCIAGASKTATPFGRR